MRTGLSQERAVATGEARSSVHAEHEAVLHEDDLLALAGCAVARRQFPDLGFSDPLAEEILDALALDPARFDERKLRSATVRTMVVDSLVREFFDRHPCGIALAILPGLCTRFSRIDNGSLHWVDLETAEVALFKQRFAQTSDRHVILPCCSIAWEGWMRLLACAVDTPMLVVAQDGFRRAPLELRDGFFMRAAQHLPSGTEIVLEYDARAPIRPSSPNERCASLAAVGESGAWASYPRIRFVQPSEHEEQLEHELAGLNAVSRLFRGRGVPSVAHLRFA